MKDGFHVGKLKIGSRVLVAPMSGITDLPFRRVLQNFGPGYVVSEMVAGKELAEGHPETELRATGRSEIDPLVIQLVGNDETWMRKGASRADALGADIIDINMGCPARKVVTGAAGSALMRDLDHAERLVAAVLEGTDKPVTLKMRLGWDDGSRNARELACRAQSLGVAAIIVHGRTRCQFYEGRADWRAIKEVKAAVDVPVVVNGDIESTASAEDALEQSGADAVMVGRALVGRPWLLAEIRRGLGEKIDMPGLNRAEVAKSHYTDIIELHGTKRGVRVARKHVQAYLQHAGAAQTDVSTAMREADPDIVMGVLHEVLSNRSIAA